MKLNKYVLALITFVSFQSFAQTDIGSSGSPLSVQSEDIKINTYSIDRMITLADVDDPGSSHTKVKVIITDGGMSTDLSPRYAAYLAFSAFAEMGNLSAEFKISDKFLSTADVKARRIKAGIYEVTGHEYSESEDYMIAAVTYTIDATKMFIDEDKARNSAVGFADGKLKTSIKVTRTAKKAH